VASRKQQKEALRREREARERAAKEAERRRRLVGYGAGGALVLAALIVVGALFLSGGGGGGDNATAQLLPDGGSVPAAKATSLAKAAEAAGCETKSYRATSRDHTGDVNERIRYPTNPPAAGKHYQFPADDGAYSEAPHDTELVHSQEHGRVVIWFKPSLPESTRADLKALFDNEKGYQLLLVPRSNMPYQVAETAWNSAPEPLGTGRLLGCPTVGENTWDALQVFIQDNRGNGPEPIP
jgi:Protein of unknown function (DUF3105)